MGILSYLSCLFLLLIPNEVACSKQTTKLDYLESPKINEDCKIDVEYTPKEYIQMVKAGQHMISAGIPQGYYDSAIGLAGQELKNALGAIISKNYKKYTYKNVWIFCKEADLNPKNHSEIWEIYMERGWDKEQTYGKNGIYKGWNREHMWPKSHGNFGTRMGPGTDFHHLRPADSRQNSYRNNMNYCYVEGERTKSGGCYEPPLSAKGDAARAIFYMATRWNKAKYNLYTDNSKEISKTGRVGREKDLLKWHDLDPVDAYEIRRMNIAYQWQHNRNPYIDHPELIEHIWGNKREVVWEGGITIKNKAECKSKESADQEEQVQKQKYPYIKPKMDKDCKIIIKDTPKEYIKRAIPGKHMISWGIPKGYYDSAIGLSGKKLKRVLGAIISKNYKKYTYKKVWEFCKEADLNPKNHSEIWEIYMERGWDKEQTYGKNGIYKGWNREHMWPKSHGNFGTRMGPGTDFHHLRPADSRQNSYRNNMNYCNVKGPRTKAYGCYEPPLSAKGDAARAIFYMATRWQKDKYFLRIDNNRKISKLRRIGMLKDLLSWHNLDPVAPMEINRMNIAYKWQHNRNPFIDHPELVEYIWGSKIGLPWDGGIILDAKCAL